MQISFDPLQQEEAAAVRAMLDVLAQRQLDSEFPKIDRLLDPADAGAVFVPAGQTYTPLPEDAGKVVFMESSVAASAAPSTAAADLFSTAPAARQDGQATQPAVPAPPVPVPSAPTAPAASPSLADVDSTGLPWDERIHSGTKAKNADGTWRARRGMNDAAKVKEVEAELRALMALSGSPLPSSAVSTAPATASSTSTTGDTTEYVQSATAPVVSTPPIPAPPTAATPAVSATAQAEQSPAVPAAPATVPAAPIASVQETGTTPASVATAQPVQADAPNAAPATSAPPTAPIPSPPVPPAPTAEGSTVPDTFGPLMTYLAKRVSEGKTTEPQIHEVFNRHGIAKGKFGELISKPDVLAAIVGELRLMGI